jgi:hypothetical protein
MTLVPVEPETIRARPARARRRAVAPPVHVPYWRRALRWLVVPRRAYTALVVASSSVLVAGIALIYPPLALIVAGLAGGFLGLIGLGITVRGTK